MFITKRDEELLNWINRFGYVSIRQIAVYWKISEVTAYGRMKKLVSNEYLVHQRFLYQAPGLYWVSKKGAQLAGSQLPPIKRVAIATIRHQLALVNLYLQLQKKKSVHFVTERELRCQSGIGSKAHMPDGLVINGDERIALEVELTVKSKKRITQILNQYRKDFSYQSVWYFCGNNEVMNQLTNQARNYQFLKVHRLDAWIAPHASRS